MTFIGNGGNRADAEGFIGNVAPGGDAVLTVEGGIAIPMINDTGATSVKGTLVCASSTADFAVEICAADEKDTVGAVYNDGVPNGDVMYVVVSGVADVLLEDNTTATRAYWARLSETQAGRADITNPNPPGGTIIEIDNHFAEIGHGLETVSAGIDQLARCVLHFN